MDDFTGGTGLVVRVCALVVVMEKCQKKVEKKEGNTSKAGGEAKGEERGEKRCVSGGMEASIAYTIFHCISTQFPLLLPQPCQRKLQCGSQTPACSHLLPKNTSVRQHQLLELGLSAPWKASEKHWAQQGNISLLPCN